MGIGNKMQGDDMQFLSKPNRCMINFLEIMGVSTSWVQRNERCCNCVHINGERAIPY